MPGRLCREIGEDAVRHLQGGHGLFAPGGNIGCAQACIERRGDGLLN
jgi:hypothetical protein